MHYKFTVRSIQVDTGIPENSRNSFVGGTKDHSLQRMIPELVGLGWREVQCTLAEFRLEVHVQGTGPFGERHHRYEYMVMVIVHRASCIVPGFHAPPSVVAHGRGDSGNASGED